MEWTLHQKIAFNYKDRIKIEIKGTVLFLTGGLAVLTSLIFVESIFRRHCFLVCVDLCYVCRLDLLFMHE